MSSFDRVRKDKNGRVFVPMNVEGGVDDGFFTPLKLVTAIFMLIIVVYEFMLISNGSLKPFGAVSCIVITLLVFFYMTRYILLDERYYYRMYKKMKQYKNPTPSVFWDIVDVYDSEDGSIVIYSDIKLGVLVKMEKDTIIGRDDEFKRTHYDAIAEFIKEMNLRELSYVQLNIMEHADKDPRLQVLDDTVLKCKNRNIAKLLEMQTGYLKVMARKTLYESEYYLIYTYQSSKLDTLLGDVYECLYKLMDGAYSGFQVLRKEDIYDLVMTLYGVRYFDAKSATLAVFGRSGANIKPTFQLKQLYFEDGEVVDVGDKENIALNRVTSMKKHGKIPKGELSIRDAFKGNGIYKISTENNVYRKPTQADANIKKDNKAKGKEEVHTVEWDESLGMDEIFFGENEYSSIEEANGLVNEIEDASKVAQDMNGTSNKKKKLFGKK